MERPLDSVSHSSQMTSRTYGWWDLPVEIHREIFAFLPFWTLQQRRGVSKQWCRTIDSLNPDYPDEQSQRLLLWCQPWISSFWVAQTGALLGSPCLPVATDWRGRENVYPPETLCRDDGKRLLSVSRFLKWYAKPHRCHPRREVTACITDIEIIFLPACVCCKVCWKHQSSALCPNHACSACCKSTACAKHYRGPPERPCSACKHNDHAMACRRKRCGYCCKCNAHKSSGFRRS
jgi:F-box associated protein